MSIHADIDDASVNEFLQQVNQQLKSNKSTNNKQEIYLEDENGIPLSGFEAYPFIKEGLKKKWEINSAGQTRNALKESQETPDALTVVSPHYNKNIQKVSKFTNKLVNKVIALTVKNML